MVPPRKKSRSSGIISMLILSILGTAVLAGSLGWVYGVHYASTFFTAEQMEFVDGVVDGHQFRQDYENWLKDKPTNDPRTFPDIRCASRFYPHSPLGMAGCMEAIEGRPEGGYQIPR